MTWKRRYNEGVEKAWAFLCDIHRSKSISNIQAHTRTASPMWSPEPLKVYARAHDSSAPTHKWLSDSVSLRVEVESQWVALGAHTAILLYSILFLCLFFVFLWWLPLKFTCSRHCPEWSLCLRCAVLSLKDTKITVPPSRLFGCHIITWASP